nr:ABC transporter transmembrane domain-containing protein [Bacteroidales bacterium]
MNYNLNSQSEKTEIKAGGIASLRKLLLIIGEEKRRVTAAFISIFINAGLNLLGPYLIAVTIDEHIQTKDYEGVVTYSLILVSLYLTSFVVNYLQMRLMGGIGQRMLFRLRNSVFNKLQELPLDFFNQN